MTDHPVLAHDWWPRPIPRNVTIGERTWVHSAFAFAHFESRVPEGVSIGNDTGVYINTLFDLGQRGRVVIGDFCTIVGLIVATDGTVTIGDYSFIAHDVLIADSMAAVPPRSRAVLEHGPDRHRLGGAVEIGRDVWVGARATLLSGTEIGDGAIIGAATVVDSKVPPGAIYAGDPGRIVGYAGRIDA